MLLKGFNLWHSCDDPMIKVRIIVTMLISLDKSDLTGTIYGACLQKGLRS